MVIDTSAILAWLKDEPQRARIVAALEAHGARRLSAVSLLEAQIVVRGREHPALLGKLERFLDEIDAIVTPFDERLRVDDDAFVSLMTHLAANGSDGFVVCGTTGEASTLSDEEHLGLVELAVRERPDGVTIIAGAGSNDTAHAVELTGRACELGVDAVLSVTPYYNRPNRRGILAHFEAVAAASTST